MELSEPEVGAWDCVLLDPLTEATFISNIHQRFKRDHIYTYIGNELLSVNPYKKLALYSADLVKAYEDRGPYQLPPHLYGIAGSAYRFLRDRNEDQCIVVCGESGSGKTEAARIVLQFIIVTTGQSQELRQMKERLVHAGTVLEAFGNAKTCRNDNSSRFGKYLDIEFDYKADPIGATITNYLLEKSRVTSHSIGERNFHIFYQLLTGADIQLLKCLKLQRNLENYAFLRSSQFHAQENIDDKNDFQLTKKAMEVVGFSPEEIVNVLKVVASVLKLGNIGFVPANNIDGTEGCTISNDYELFEVCALLNGSHATLHTALTCRTVDESVTVELGSSEATRGRDLLAKAFYGRLFTWLVNRINDFNKVHPALDVSHEFGTATALYSLGIECRLILQVKHQGKRKVLAILDMYGFEVLERNSFDQFIINFCNEKLHQVITDWTLKQEQEEYIKEGLDWTLIPFFNNGLICELIERNNHGILGLLDEEPGDSEFLARLAQTCAGHAHCEVAQSCTTHTSNPKGDNSLPNNCFRLKHYAGTVTYSVQSFVSKNKDLLPRDISVAMFSCEHPLMKTLFPEGNPKRPNVKRPATAGTQFKIALGSLVRNMSTKEVHYIRCIKPNELKQPRIFETALVQHQVRYLGLVESVRVRRSGFCYRMLYQPFLARYKMLSLHTWPHCRNRPPVESVAYLVRDLPIPSAEFAFGRTKLFVRSPRTVFELEKFRRERLHDLAILLQKIWRGYRQKKIFQKKRRSQILIASAWRSWKAREEYRVLKRRKQVEWAVSVIQRHYVRWKKRQFLMRLAYELPAESDSPISRVWPPCYRRLAETSLLLRRIHHKWRCHKYRLRFDQTARNRLREKVTASIIFKDRKASYPRSVSHPFLGDYVRLRQNVQWKKTCVETNDQYVVFADIVNKIARSSGKFVPILFVLSTSSMLILDQRTLQVKYRVPATEIYRLSLSPFLDDVAVFHVRAPSPVADVKDNIPGCLFQSDLGKKKGDFVFQTGHVIEIVTKLFLVVQNAVGKPPEVNISTEFEANFGQQTVMFAFKSIGLPEVAPGQIRIVRKGNKMEVLV